MKTFVIYTMLFGFGMPTHDEAHFTNMSGCQVYLAATYDEQVRESFKLICVDVSPPMCQGHVCE
jgi:hypothetical protein